ncbi:branched-chain amino acid ABC transporter substrate-binding protein [Paracoccus aestuarii]|uniref:Branched-chain amino acid ABC transporter substrate-binding protein n=1 Tax=Paracoccus aestuarii TaxID=453842 RepID=A0A418ZX38_9RHOB|nr:ABC transporter substrate-binding protein [Paracoccus aestuarii]RJL05056.1 branched-chain amino acid ABC transporter substrate-binding protein [Paracoccus aestuarii]WCQ99221.1 ABC transporter substrate-binding protein [Paracoccus aestuarii]
MFKRLTAILVGATALALPLAATAQDPVVIRSAVLRVDDPGLPPISRLELPPADLGFAGARLAIEDNDTTGRFMGQDFEAGEVAASPDTAAEALETLLADGVQFIVIMADDDTTLALADQAGDRAMLFNALARGDNLRGADCRWNMIHVAPSRAMLADGLAQFLMWKNWPRWFLIHGSHPQDQAMAEAYRRAATKFGARIVETREYEDTGGARRTDSGHVQVQAQMPVFTQRAADHDIVITADEAGVFAAYLPYLTWDPRPVAGSAGLVPRSWHPAMEAWGGTQFQTRFERLAERPIREEDYQAWLSLRIVGEAATRTQSGDPQVLRDYILSDDFDVAGFKGQALTVRDWDHQMRQPILLTTGLLTTSVSPQDQYLHQTSQLDTMGLDRPETECQFPEAR